MCFLNNKVVLDYSKSCKSCITVDDIKAAKKECLEQKNSGLRPSIRECIEGYRPASSPFSSERTVALSDLARDKRQLENDILRIKLEREKLLLEKELDCSLVFEKIEPLPSQLKTDHSEVNTFLCESCGEYVLLPEEGVGKRVRWKCRICHQENCFDVARE